MEAGLSSLLGGFTARLQAVGREGALPALLLPFLFSGELQNLITHSSGRALKISDLIISFVLWVAVKSTCCQGDLAVVAAVQQWEKRPHERARAEGLLPTVQLHRAACTVPAAQVLSCKTWIAWMRCKWEVSTFWTPSEALQMPFLGNVHEGPARKGLDHHLWRGGCLAVAWWAIEKVVG